MGRLRRDARPRSCATQIRVGTPNFLDCRYFFVGFEMEAIWPEWILSVWLAILSFLILDRIWNRRYFP